jgi:RND family efflux transporter MFP subunit
MMTTRLLMAPALALILAGCSEGHAAQDSQQHEPVVPVKMTTLAASPIDEYSEYIATIRSRRSVEVRPQVEGYVARILVKPGEVVIDGAQLIQIDPKRQQATTSSALAASGIASAEVERSRATLSQLEAARAGRQAALKLAEEDHRRATELRKSGAIAAQAEDQATATLEGARAELAANDRQIAAQRAGIQSAEKSLVQTQASAQAQSVELQYYRVGAPFAGTVGDVPVKVGDLVNPATLITTIDDPTAPLEALVSVPVEDARRLHTGLTAKVVDPSATNALLDEGKVAFVSPRIDPSTQSILVKVDLNGSGSGDDKQTTLRAQQFLRARIVWSSEPGIRIPLTSITRLNGQTFAFVVKDGGTALQSPIKVGDVSGNDVIVKEGLKAGDVIVSSGIQKIRNGSKVAPAPAQQATQ